MSPVRHELRFYIPEDAFFIVTAVKTSNLTDEEQHFSNILNNEEIICGH
jgi:hypothetical protein